VSLDSRKRKIQVLRKPKRLKIALHILNNVIYDLFVLPLCIIRIFILCDINKMHIYIYKVVCLEKINEFYHK
jgi:hypothetical protein